VGDHDTLTILLLTTDRSGGVRSGEQMGPKSVYILPSWNMYSTRKTCSSIERTIVSKNWIQQLNTLPVLHLNYCLTTEYSETAHFNSNFDTDNQIYVPYHTVA
jgi:hypothetical protein